VHPSEASRLSELGVSDIQIEEESR